MPIRRNRPDVPEVPTKQSKGQGKLTDKVRKRRRGDPSAHLEPSVSA